MDSCTLLHRAHLRAAKHSSSSSPPRPSKAPATDCTAQVVLALLAHCPGTEPGLLLDCVRWGAMSIEEREAAILYAKSQNGSRVPEAVLAQVGCLHVPF